MRLLLACLLVALSATQAAAEAMKVGDLGPVPSRQTCLSTARTALERYLDAHGGLSVTGETDTPENWSIYGWGLRPGNNDVVILCPMVAGESHAFYAIHSDGPQAVENADTTARRIRALWDSLH